MLPPLFLVSVDKHSGRGIPDLRGFVSLSPRIPDVDSFVFVSSDTCSIYDILK